MYQHKIPNYLRNNVSWSEGTGHQFCNNFTLAINKWLITKGIQYSHFKLWNFSSALPSRSVHPGFQLTSTL
jgi:hypothetical protein